MGKMWTLRALVSLLRLRVLQQMALQACMMAVKQTMPLRIRQKPHTP